MRAQALRSFQESGRDATGAAHLTAQPARLPRGEARPQETAPALEAREDFARRLRARNP